ncbi:hypothetical protein PV327_010732 [Microctonus hyperodae]|uniref:Uncharacterized protein n=1 Tax=Microctonus hyperodae TaxID=165561 RepID=A0AA39C867_MICHY|nr:hypothetical protein PV327_010732 [Microctonus hyperodae]
MKKNNSPVIYHLTENDNTGKTADITFFYVQTVDGSIISKQEIKFNEFDKKKSDKLIDKKKTLKKTSVKIVDDIILQKKINLSELNNTTLDNNEKKTKLIGQNRQIHFTTEEMKKRKILHSSEFNPMNKDEINSYGIRTTIPSRQSLLPTKRPVISEEINNKLVRAFENWVKIPEIAELLQERPDIKILKPKVNLKDRLGDYVKNDNDKYEKIQSQRGIITINPQKLTPIKPIPISPFNVASPKESIISNKVFIESPLINNHNEISRVPKNQLISSNPMIKEQYISPQERVPITTINPPHQISSNVSAFNRITYKRPLESQKSSNLSEEPQNKRKTVWKRDYDDLESEDSSVENPIVDNSSSKSQHTVESIGNSQSSSILTTESITQRVKNWCYDGRETISPIGNADDNSNSCHSLSSVKTIIFSPKESNLSSSLLLHVNNNDISIDKCQEINEKMDLEIVNDYDSHNSILSTSYCSSTSSITSSLATESAGINLIDDIQVNCNEKKDDAGHLSPINLPMKSSITDLPDDSNTKQDDDKQSLSSNLSRKSSAISLCDDLNIPEDNNEEENSQNEIVTDTNKINDGNYNINDNNTINNNFNENSNNNNNNNQFNVDPEDEEKIDDCDVISLYAESIESLQVNDIDTKDERERESIYSSSSLNRYNLMKSENIGCYVSQNVREFDALYNNENNDDQNNNIPIARPKGVFTRLQPLNSTTEESQNINNNGINRNIPTQNFTDYQQFNVPSTVRHYNYNNFINYNETQQKFRGYCYSILKRNICNKCDCKFKHTIEDYLLYVHLGQNYEIKSVLNYAIQEKFIYYLKLVYENSIKKLDLPDIIEVFSSVLSLNFPYVVYECFNSTLKVFPKHSNKMFQFINGICQNMQPSTNITDDKITLNLIELLMKHIEPGKYWEYLRGLILKMAFPTLKIIEIILDECSRYKKSPQHVHDIKKIIIDNADENVLREIDPLIISNFMKLYDDLRNFHELKSSPNQIEKTAFVSSIASPDLINTNNSNKIIINEQNGRIMAEDILPIKRISTDLRNRLGFKQPDNSAKWKLMKIDNIDKLNSVYKKQLERLHDDLELLSIALNKKDYDTILSILTIARVGLLQEHIFAYGKGFYEILCKCIMDAPEHLEKIILITGNKYFIKQSNGNINIVYE